ncbi:response regulator transcription factor [Cellulosilyticum sp. WCF-2]|uniref:response regulator transcription factor n=1 Tax=Cellulosilyticum sp. WCF-2 TaxID=2497860 RepID=UPI000F8D6F81|nr:response regulator transcription factor [Cellulosilyticum sp. WCF-2]QEH67080.1 response regulator transcription factor [Cellulosilyticum sp. WCF-2]
MSSIVALIEDEKNLRDIIKSYLEKESYKVLAYESVEAVGDLNEEVHLWILDIMLPGKSGFEMMERIRKEDAKVPIILISARDQDFDKIMGLEKGADDYIAKPFSPKELVLRVKKLLDRCYQKEESVTLAGYTIELKTRKVYDKGELVDLSNREYMLLLFLYKNKEHPLTRNEILDHVWERDYFGNDRVVDDLMRRMRKKMPRLQVETIYGYGYRLEGN